MGTFIPETMSTKNECMAATDALLEIRASGPHGIESWEKCGRAAAAASFVTHNASNAILYDATVAALAATSARFQLAVAHANAVSSLGHCSLNEARSWVNSVPQNKVYASVDRDSASSPSDHGQAQSEKVRKEKIAAALRSKPQRGRKRKDLSEEERLELIRTRNREHAKTTRIRKKARYEELLKQEEDLLLLQAHEKRQQALKEKVLAFVDLRQEMLRSWNNGGVSTRLSELVSRDFTFQSSHLLVGEKCGEESPLNVMKQWDNSIIEWISESMLKNCVYAVEGGLEGVAISAENMAFCQVHLFHESGTERRLLWKGVVSAQFTEVESKRLKSVCWTTVANLFPPRLSSYSRQNGYAEGATFHQNFIHPSVVSLEHHGV